MRVARLVIVLLVTCLAFACLELSAPAWRRPDSTAAPRRDTLYYKTP